MVFSVAIVDSITVTHNFKKVYEEVKNRAPAFLPVFSGNDALT